MNHKLSKQELQKRKDALRLASNLENIKENSLKMTKLTLELLGEAKDLEDQWMIAFDNANMYKKIKTNFLIMSNEVDNILEVTISEGIYDKSAFSCRKINSTEMMKAHVMAVNKAQFVLKTPLFFFLHEEDQTRYPGFFIPSFFGWDGPDIINLFVMSGNKTSASSLIHDYCYYFHLYNKVEIDNWFSDNSSFRITKWLSKLAFKTRFSDDAYETREADLSTMKAIIDVSEAQIAVILHSLSTRGLKDFGQLTKSMRALVKDSIIIEEAEKKKGSSLEKEEKQEKSNEQQ